jgi:hypothetical protein
MRRAGEVLAAICDGKYRSAGRPRPLLSKVFAALAWDLVGAAGAAFVTSLVAIPVLGLVRVALGCAVLCLAAAAVNLRRA